mmetsp:Transcript_118423/g.335776  ORF Transcript_118423/g.335776 Transcript_118423/m.335776 type:complete len:200 (+) Transcript_118423:577-1176(+)
MPTRGASSTARAWSSGVTRSCCRGSRPRCSCPSSSRAPRPSRGRRTPARRTARRSASWTWFATRPRSASRSSTTSRRGRGPARSRSRAGAAASISATSPATSSTSWRRFSRTAFVLPPSPAGARRSWPQGPSGWQSAPMPARWSSELPTRAGACLSAPRTRCGRTRSQRRPCRPRPSTSRTRPRTTAWGCRRPRSSRGA